MFSPSLDAPSCHLILGSQEDSIVHSWLQLDVHDRVEIAVAVVLRDDFWCLVVQRRLHRNEGLLSLRQSQRLLIKHGFRLHLSLDISCGLNFFFQLWSFLLFGIWLLLWLSELILPLDIWVAWLGLIVVRLWVDRQNYSLFISICIELDQSIKESWVRARDIVHCLQDWSGQKLTHSSI